MEEEKKENLSPFGRSPAGRENNEIEDEPQNELSKCEKERDEHLDGWKRAKADLINYKKDEAKRFEEMMRFGQEIFVRDLLRVLDSFDLALISGDFPDSKSEKGMYLIRQQLEDILRQRGLEKIKVFPGDKFNPSLHEAIAEMESNKPPGIIIEEVEKGYLLHGKVIRPARVKVAK